MSTTQLIRHSLAASILVASAAGMAAAQVPKAGYGALSDGDTQRTIAQAAEQGKYTFVLFYDTNDSATNSMAAALNEGLSQVPGQALVSYAQVSNPAEQPLVAKYGLARAALPVTLAIAPNGAVTGAFAQRLSAEGVHSAFVSPTMMFTMKSVQEGKIVMVNVEGASPSRTPAAIVAFQADPHFAQRLAVTSMRAGDPQEAKFVRQMQLDPSAGGSQLVMIAPPGVLVGKFDGNASKEQIAAALAKAGKCCDDPQCKHNR